jgi:small subunit ribosomal protein S3
LEKRMPYRRVIKTVIEKAMAKGVKWIKVQIAGRLNGAEMARWETFKDGRIPLQTLRADIDYHYTTALTKYGILGIKVWIYKWDIEDNKKSHSTTKRRNTRTRKVTKK